MKNEVKQTASLMLRRLFSKQLLNLAVYDEENTGDQGTNPGDNTDNATA
jgi:hypothetical protein